MNPRRPTPTQLAALVGVAVREVTWTIPHVRRELRAWRQRALRIPDAGLRDDALTTLDREHMNPQGAALFAVLPRSRNLALLRLLVAHQVALDFLDTVTERPAEDSLAHGAQLHRALVDAVDPTSGHGDYYRHRPGQDDGGYLRALVDVCREGCAALPAFDVVGPLVRRAAQDLSVQVLNHLDDAAERDVALQAWVRSRIASGGSLAWFEHTAAASSTLGLFALLAAATDSHLTEDEACAIDAAYHPTICLACTLMDSFADATEDAAAGEHSYVAHYRSMQAAVDRICEVSTRSLVDARRLAGGARHAVIVGGMISMYLATDAAATRAQRAHARRIRSEVGWIATVAIPVTRVMRQCSGVARAGRLPNTE